MAKKQKIKKTLDNNELLMELIQKQITDVDPKKKLQYSDLKRICKYVTTSIFDENQCCIWGGYVTNSNNSCKGTYINFYFRKKKAALHRLLYSNFIEDLKPNEYLKFNCENRGRCCNIAHLKKFKYNKKYKNSSNTNGSINRNKSKKKGAKIVKIVNSSCCDQSRLIISFD